MKRKKYVGSTSGVDFENKIMNSLKSHDIAFTRENTLTNAKVRRKDKSVDIVLDNHDLNIELKSTTEKQGLDYSLWDDGRSHKIKFHQICAADYFILEFRPHEARVISKLEFLSWAANQLKHSITWKDAKNLGVPYSEWIEKLVSDT